MAKFSLHQVEYELARRDGEAARARLILELLTSVSLASQGLGASFPPVTQT